MHKKNLTKLLLIGIILLAATLRFYGLNWDQGYHLHPDERAIILATVNLQFPASISQFFSVNSPWNPHFFAYGSLPFYLLHFIGELLGKIANPKFAEYAFIQIPGRFISAISDLSVIVVLFFLVRKLSDLKTAIFSALFYTIAALPIQLSHFYAVDTLLSFFVLTTIYLLINFYEKPSIKRGVLVGLFFGLSLATKVSALVLLSSIGVSLVIDFVLIFLKKPHKPMHWLPHLPVFLKHLIKYALIIMVITIVTFIFFEPYAIIDFKNFWTQTLQQQAMTKNAFTFPYTLQYVGKIPYIYELKNIFFFGLGPISTVLSFIGAFIFIKNARIKDFIIIAFFLTYFLVVGKFAVGFMRYMLPVYPILCFFAAIAAVRFIAFLKTKSPNRQIFYTLCATFFTLLLVWPLSFIQIYGGNNTRTDASNWIFGNITPGKMLLVEHWDDRLPIYGSDRYVIEDLELYNPESKEKWQKIYSQLQRADYIIIASNRLYVPLQKLTECSRLPTYKCYPQTALYYHQLFSGQLGFQKIAEFINYPKIPLLNIKIDDFEADESFTVYDHPKIMIFKKIKTLNEGY